MLKSFNGPLLFYFFNEPLLFYFLVVKAIELFEPLVVGRDVQNIFDDFANYWRELVNEDQIRWVREIFFLCFSPLRQVRSPLAIALLLDARMILK